ncbi:carboxymuconolactone decarboxylase family protein [bacterium]|nr:carboxymuconolactone decarboxylase family protein [bacterium]
MNAEKESLSDAMVAIDSFVKSYTMLDDRLKRIYARFYKETYRPGTSSLDHKMKELIAVAVAAALGCKNCLEGHIKKAIADGATPAELSDALAVTVGVAAASVVDRTDIAVANLGLEDFFKSLHRRHTEDGNADA